MDTGKVIIGYKNSNLGFYDYNLKKIIYDNVINFETSSLKQQYINKNLLYSGNDIVKMITDQKDINIKYLKNDYLNLDIDLSYLVYLKKNKISMIKILKCTICLKVYIIKTKKKF